MTSAQDKTASRIKITIGNVTFSGTGNHEWLAEQLDKVLEIAASHPASLDQPASKQDKTPKIQTSNAQELSSNVGSLVSYLKSKDAMSNQTKRFLATAAWLTKKGTTSLKTADVSKALKENQQSKLSNPADCLNKNVGKGFCEKSSDTFFVTPEGWTELGDTI